MTPAPGRAVLQVGDGWRRYDRPAGAVVARTTAEVRPALAEVEAAVAAGRHAVGLLAYEAAPAFDPAFVTHPPGDFPLVWFGLYDSYETIDEPADEGDAAPDSTPWQPCLERAAYESAIARIKDYIASGDTYQVNYTIRLHHPLSEDPWRLTQRLWRSQRARYGAYLDLGDHVVGSASPELFFRLDGELVTGRPMKGTAPRGRWPAEDRAQAAALVASAKDRAENLMIVDMIRNDLGRLAEIGSVRVPNLFAVERYDQVWQMTSTVTARCHLPATGILAGLFPCASITGAPKVRTMEIIGELEPEPRGVYTGAIGVLSPGRQAQFNVAIRTVQIDRAAGRATFGVGGGIVWDSTAAAEYEECRTKSLVLTRPTPEFKLLETLLWSPDGGYFLGDRHLTRMAQSAAYFGFPLDVTALVAALRPDWSDPRRVRVTCDRRGRIEVESRPADPPPERPWRVALAAEPVDSGDRFLYHKTTWRGVYERARASRPGCDEVLLYNERGELTEGTIANLVIRIDGQPLTPPVACGLLPGTYRQELLDSGAITERVLRPEDLAEAEAVYLINSVRRWVEVELIAPA